MNTLEVIKCSNSDEHGKLLSIMRNWSEVKNERLKTKQKAFQNGEYQEVINRLRAQSEVNVSL